MLFILYGIVNELGGGGVEYVSLLIFVIIYIWMVVGLIMCVWNWFYVLLSFWMLI